MNKIVLMIVLLACSGCVSIANSVVPAPQPVRPFERITLGMTRPVVAAIMDARVTVGYDIDRASGISRPVDVQNLYSSELLTVSAVTYQVDHYIVHSPAPGTRVGVADLFPVVYKDGLVVAKGREGLDNIRAAR